MAEERGDGNCADAPIVRSIGGIGESYGGMMVKAEGGATFTWVKDFDHLGHWQPIPQYLYDALMKYEDERSNL